ncbi:MAG: DUF2493 domain-containing protein [Clostridia bacterium]|nr:DUF2493 domain-containing protein [Clostridia bacterium]
MKVAVVGSRTLTIDNLGSYLPSETTEIVSGGAKGIDTCAREYATANNIKLTEFLPEYERYGRAAPLARNKKIVEYAEVIVVFWDGKTNGTKMILEYCEKRGKTAYIHIIK